MIEKMLTVSLSALLLFSCTQKKKAPETVDDVYTEPHRPQLHFTPAKNWMNDPNGLVYYAGQYHLFYQYYPDAMVWGPMHWGHATSTDLLHWRHLPIALYPDSLGMIFSGSAVIDHDNSSGLGTGSNPPMVAVFTYHSAEREKAGFKDYQTQGLAYSLDSGRTWNKYANNPIIPNPGFKDFRDPKVFWHEPTKKWIVTVVAGNHAQFYGSPDLLHWTKLSEFGVEYGSHGGVWECPDLFPLSVEGDTTKKWILIVNINPGGPNGGSGTQYFIGDFDGKTFRCDTDKSKVSWIDYGPDNYAGVTWSNTPDDRRILIGWMSNWAYGQDVPTSPWRSANTIPRELKLIRSDNSFQVISTVVSEVGRHATNEKVFPAMELRDSIDLTSEVKFPISTSLIHGAIGAGDFTMTLSNARGQNVVLGYQLEKNIFSIDRAKSGDVSFSKAFAAPITAPRTGTKDSISFTIVLDVSSMEVFFDDGRTVMTCLFFPDERFDRVVFRPGESPLKIEFLSVSSLPSVWQSDAHPE